MHTQDTFSAATAEDYHAALGRLTHYDYDVKFIGEPKRYAQHTAFLNRQPFCRSVSDMHMSEPTRYFLAR